MTTPEDSVQLVSGRMPRKHADGFYSARLRELATHVPERTALVLRTKETDSRLTYREFNNRVDAVARSLLDQGVGEGSGVIIVSENSSLAVIASAAAWRCGAFVVPISHKSTANDLKETVANLEESGRRAFVVSKAQGISKRWPHIDFESLENCEYRGENPDRATIPARAVPSGGTTGRPKLIVDQSEWGYFPDTGIAAVLSAMGWAESKSVLVFSPLYHNVGQTLTHQGLMFGKTVVLMEKFDADLACQLIEQEEIEFFFAVPTHMRRMLAVDDVSSRIFHSIKSMYHAGSACPQELKRSWLRMLGPERVWEMYGATEGTGFTLVRGDEWLRHEGTVGRPWQCEIQVRDDDLKQLPPGEIGTIFTRSLDGADDNPEGAYLGAEAPFVTDDGFRTVGDLGWIDELGYLYITDRRTDLIISGGANVFPAEVEKAIRSHPKVSDAAVVGLPDDDWGRRVHAIIMPVDEDDLPSKEDLDSHISDQILPYKKPKSYEFRKELAVTDVGKIDRRLMTLEAMSAIDR